MLTEILAIDKHSLKSFCRLNYIRRLAIFGSALRPDFDEQSDIDILVEFSPEHIPGFLKLWEIEQELSTFFNKRQQNIPWQAIIGMRHKVVHD